MHLAAAGLLVALRHTRGYKIIHRTLKLDGAFARKLASSSRACRECVGGASTAAIYSVIGGHRLKLLKECLSLVRIVRLAEARCTLYRAGSTPQPLGPGCACVGRRCFLLSLRSAIGSASPLALLWCRAGARRCSAADRTASVRRSGEQCAQAFRRAVRKCHDSLFVRCARPLACPAIQGLSSSPTIQRSSRFDGIEWRRGASFHREHQGPHGVLPAPPASARICHCAPTSRTCPI